MKSLSTKLAAATFIIAMASGCASVTDAGLQPEAQPVVEQTTPSPTPQPIMGGDESQPIAEKPLD